MSEPTLPAALPRVRLRAGVASPGPRAARRSRQWMLASAISLVFHASAFALLAHWLVTAPAATLESGGYGVSIVWGGGHGSGHAGPSEQHAAAGGAPALDPPASPPAPRASDARAVAEAEPHRLDRLLAAGAAADLVRDPSLDPPVAPRAAESVAAGSAAAAVDGSASGDVSGAGHGAGSGGGEGSGDGDAMGAGTGDGATDGIGGGEGLGAGIASGAGTGSGIGQGDGAARITPPLPLADNAQPEYPEDARRRGAEGVVKVLVSVGRDGAALSAAVAESCGSADLDQAALDAVLQWRFAPALGADEPAERLLRLPIVFRLEAAES